MTVAEKNSLRSKWGEGFRKNIFKSWEKCVYPFVTESDGFEPPVFDPMDQQVMGKRLD